jgi:hypothetical protein
MSRGAEVFGWLAAAGEALGSDPAFRKLGSADFRLGLAAGSETRLVEFTAFGVAPDAVQPADLRDADLVIEMTADAWRAYLDARAQGTGPSLLALDLDGPIVRAPDPARALLLERYNLSVQALVDCGARLAAGNG